MIVANRRDFLACLDRYPSCNSLELFAFSKARLLAAAEEVGFEDFSGQDYDVLGRLGRALEEREGEAAWWGLVFIELWFGDDFGGRHWSELLARDPTNVRYAIQAAYWADTQADESGGPALAGIINQCHCWGAAQQHFYHQRDKGLRDWWYEVLRWRE